MSELQKNMLKSKLPPKIPSARKLAPFGGSRRKDYTPVSWRTYYERYVDLVTENGTFRVYLSKEPDHADRPRIVTLHGGGYSGLSWSLFTEEVTSMINCQVVSIDIRGHGETKAKEPDDLSSDTLVRDIELIIHQLFGEEIPPIVLVGHSMGGAIAVRVAQVASLEHCLQGLAVIDVVEGTALDALASMQSFLRGRPTHFKSIEHAIEWCVRSGQVRNLDSAKVSMPSQIINCETNCLAINEVDTYTSEGPSALTAFHPPPAVDSIVEEVLGAEDLDKPSSVPQSEQEFVKPADVDGGMKYKWRIDLSKTEAFWSGWFKGLSAAFLSVRAPRLLLLASIDGLDRELTVGQMQGKFQMQVLTRCGHAVHEDNPSEVARVVASFMLRHKLTCATDEGEHMNLVSAPGC